MICCGPGWFDRVILSGLRRFSDYLVKSCLAREIVQGCGKSRQVDMQGGQMATLMPDQMRLPQLHAQPHPRNPGMALDLDWVASAQANTSAIERRTAALPGRRSVKKDFQAAWLLKAISLIDLTTLSGDDTPGRVKRLCAKARQPVRPELLDALGMTGLTVGAVCVYHDMVETAVQALAGSGIPVAAVSTGFPAGLSPLHLRMAEIGESVRAGAQEIDIVISRRHVLTGNWQALYDEMREMRAACGDAHVKAIIRAIRDYQDRTGIKVGYKPAGGIAKAKDALVYLSLMKDELGHDWLQPDLFRFGASSLLGDIERQLDHHLTGRYSAGFRHAMG